ncbi:DUF4369 domain-containing protein [Hymenobacter humi]|uniref:DUF4369 domain-containing protein n=1 Tax=Hymenobacter humi TaxID=1411620 RepID=A0ABW2U0A0_9BACT
MLLPGPMMKNRVISLLLLAPGFALAQTPAPAAYPYVIKGKLGKLSAPAKVYLINGVQATDSATLKRGRFELKGTTPFPLSATLVLERQGRLQSGWRDMMFGGKMSRAYVESPDRLRLFLEPGPVVVTSPDSLRTARVAGGALTADYQRLDEILLPVAAKFKTATSKAQYEGIDKEYVQAQLAFVRAHPTSWVSLEVLGQARQMGPPQYAEVAPLYAALTPAQRTSPLAGNTGSCWRASKPRPSERRPPPSPSSRPAASRCRWPTTRASTCWWTSGPPGAAPAAPKTPPF